MTDKLKCYIVDDEERAISTLEFLLDYYCSTLAEIAGSTSSFETAAIYLSKNAPDILFLDIKLGDRTGFELLEKLGEMPNTEIIMVTAYSEHALEAFKFNAVNYLLKPVDPVALEKTITIIADRNNNRASIGAKNLLKPQQERMFYPSKNGYSSVFYTDIIYLKGDGSYTLIHTINNEQIIVSKNLAYCENLLKNQANFIRIHKSYIINKTQVKTIDKQGGLKLILVDDSAVPVSITMKGKVMGLIGL